MQPAVKTNPSPVWIKIFFAIILSLLALRFIFKNALPYFGFEEAYFDNYWSVRWWLIGHISGGLIALVIGPLQFWPYFRKNYKYTHRILGRIYLSAIFIASLCALYITIKNDYTAKWSWSVSLQGLVFAWLTTSFMAYRSARKKRFVVHRQWMIKSYIVTFAFVSFRSLQELPGLLGFAHQPNMAATFIWLSWTIPLLIADVIFQWNAHK